MPPAITNNLHDGCCIKDNENPSVFETGLFVSRGQNICGTGVPSPYGS